MLPGLLPGLPYEDNVAVLVVILLTHLLPVLPEHGDHAVVTGGDGAVGAGEQGVSTQSRCRSWRHQTLQASQRICH